MSFSLNSQLSTCLFCHLIWIWNLKRIVAQFAIFAMIAICQDAPFCHLLVIFVNPLITSCQIRHLRKICHCPKNCQLSTCPFLSSHLNIWPNPWWIFRHTRHFCPTLPFVNIPLSVTSFEVLPDRRWILPNSPFSQICHFCENCLIVKILAKFAGLEKMSFS